MGKATVKEQATNNNSSVLANGRLLGQSLNFSRTKLARAGKNKTGRGNKNLEKAVYNIAYLAATLDTP